MLQEAFGGNLIILRVLGLYPKLSLGNLYTLYKWLVVYCVIVVPIPILSFVYLMTIEEVDVQTVNDTVFLTSQVGCLIIRQLPILLNPKQFRETLHFLNIDIFTKVLPEQEHILADCQYVCKRNFRIFFVCCISTLISWAFRPIVLGLDLPQQMYHPIEIQKGTITFVVVYIYQVLNAGNAAFSNSAMDTLMSGLLYQVTAQLRILKDNLRNMHVYLQTSKDDKSYSEKVYNKMIYCIEHHNKISQLVVKLERQFSGVLFSQFIASIFVLCFGCLQLLSSTPFTYAFYAMVVFMITMTMQIFLFCYYGTLMYMENETLPDAIFSGDWYNMDQRAKKTLFIIMERAKRPLRVTAGKVFDLSLETFLMIIRRSYSLLAVMKSYK